MSSTKPSYHSSRESSQMHPIILPESHLIKLEIHRIIFLERFLVKPPIYPIIRPRSHLIKLEIHQHRPPNPQHRQHHSLDNRSVSFLIPSISLPSWFSRNITDLLGATGNILKQHRTNSKPLSVDLDYASSLVKAIQLQANESIQDCLKEILHPEEHRAKHGSTKKFACALLRFLPL